MSSDDHMTAYEHTSYDCLLLYLKTLPGVWFFHLFSLSVSVPCPLPQLTVPEQEASRDHTHSTVMLIALTDN